MAERTDINAIKSDGEPELPDRDESVKPSSGRVHRGVKPDANKDPKPAIVSYSSEYSQEHEDSDDSVYDEGYDPPACYRPHPLAHLWHRSRDSEDSEYMETDDDADLEGLDADTLRAVFEAERAIVLDKNGQPISRNKDGAVIETVNETLARPSDGDGSEYSRESEDSDDCEYDEGYDLPSAPYRLHPLARSEHRPRDSEDSEYMETDDDADLEGLDEDTLRAVLEAERPIWRDENGQLVSRNKDNAVIETTNKMPARPSDDVAATTDMMHGKTPLGQVVKSRRRKAHNFEKPQWDKSAIKQPRIKDEPIDEKRVPSLRTDKQWPAEASIVYPASGDIKLSDQSFDLQQVIRGAMKAGTKYVLWTNAFPPFESRMHLTREWLYAAAKERKAKIIKMRVKEDDGFVRGLKHLIFARVGIIRSGLKEAAVKAVTAGYSLYGTDSQQIAERVKALVVNGSYIFPKRSNAETLDHKNPFHHQVIVSIIRDKFFQKPSSFGTRYPAFFVSAHQTRLEPELPDAMVALAATAVHCALIEWQDGQRTRRSNMPFTEASFKNIYRGHFDTLTHIREKHPNQCHRIMSTLYNAVKSSVNISRPRSLPPWLDLDKEDEP